MSENKNLIPKVVHYCWLSDDPIPESLQKCMESWKEKIPDYQFKKWDFSVFPKDKSKWVEEAFDNKKYAFAADYIRLYAIYNCGGIYMDMDVEVIKRFDDLLDAPYMMAYERPNRNGIEAGCFGAKAGNAFIGDCLKYYEGRHFVREDGTFDQKPLPLIMKECMSRNGYEYNLFDYDYFTAKSFETGEEKITANTYCVHHFAGTWKTENEIKVIKDTQKLQKYFGYKIAHNMADYADVYRSQKLKGVVQLTREKIARKKEKSK